MEREEAGGWQALFGRRGARRGSRLKKKAFGLLSFSSVSPFSSSLSLSLSFLSSHALQLVRGAGLGGRRGVPVEHGSRLWTPTRAPRRKEEESEEVLLPEEEQKRSRRHLRLAADAARGRPRRPQRTAAAT